MEVGGYKSALRDMCHLHGIRVISNGEGCGDACVSTEGCGDAKCPHLKLIKTRVKTEVFRRRGIGQIETDISRSKWNK